jgi:hypothetical protein
MALSLPPDTPELRLLLGAFANGDVYLVNENGHPVAFDDVLDARCWAHLKDAHDGKVYVQELHRGSRELLSPQYLEMIGLKV